MSTEPFVISYSSSSGSGKIAWRSPCCVELVKNFGEREHRLPSNPSLSMSLMEAFVEVSVEYELIEALSTPGIHCVIEGSDDQFLAKDICCFVENVVIDIPILQHLRLNVRGRLNCSHASDTIAPIFSSLALCLCSIEESINGSITGAMDFFRKASYLARLGSGGACRSVYGGYVIWGKSDAYDDSSNFYAHPLPAEVNPGFQQMEYTILEVSPEGRKVWGGMGSNFMKAHPYSGGRFDQARNNLDRLISSLISGDHEAFADVVENEALSLQAMMMSSSKNILLLKPETVAIIEKIRMFRKTMSIPLCFTLDNSPNVYLLYPVIYKEQVSSFIQKELISYCTNKKLWNDRIGKGPEKNI